MIKQIYVKVQIDNNSERNSFDQSSDILRNFVDRCREVDSTVFKNRVGFGGNWSGDCSINFTSNKMKNIMLDQIEKNDKLQLK